MSLYFQNFTNVQMFLIKTLLLVSNLSAIPRINSILISIGSSKKTICSACIEVGKLLHVKITEPSLAYFEPKQNRDWVRDWDQTTDSVLFWNDPAWSGGSVYLQIRGITVQQKKKKKLKLANSKFCSKHI